MSTSGASASGNNKTLVSCCPDYTNVAPPSASPAAIVAIDPVNLQATFVCPATGIVQVRINVGSWITGAAIAHFGVIDVASGQTVLHSIDQGTGITEDGRVTGLWNARQLFDGTPLVPGQSYTWQLGWVNAGGAGTINLDNDYALFEIAEQDVSSNAAPSAVAKRQDVASVIVAGATAAASFTEAPLPGSLLLAFVSATVGLGSFVAPTGWNLVPAVPTVSGGTRRPGLYWRVADGTETNVSFTGTGSTYTSIHLQEWSGWASTPNLDTSFGTNGASGTNPQVTGGTTAAAPELFVACYTTQTVGVTISGGNPLVRFTDAGGAAGAASFIAVAGQTPQAVANLSANAAWAGMLATFSGA
jgi:hypothetical protein